MGNKHSDTQMEQGDHAKYLPNCRYRGNWHIKSLLKTGKCKKVKKNICGTVGNLGNYIKAREPTNATQSLLEPGKRQQ